MLLEITLIAIGLNSTFFTMELNFNLSKLWDLTITFSISWDLTNLF